MTQRYMHLSPAALDTMQPTCNRVPGKRSLVEIPCQH